MSTYYDIFKSAEKDTKIGNVVVLTLQEPQNTLSWVSYLKNDKRSNEGKLNMDINVSIN